MKVVELPLLLNHDWVGLDIFGDEILSNRCSGLLNLLYRWSRMLGCLNRQRFVRRELWPRIGRGYDGEDKHQIADEHFRTSWSRSINSPSSPNKSYRSSFHRLSPIPA